MRSAASSVFELMETASGVRNVVPVREITDASCHSHLGPVMAPGCLLQTIMGNY